MTVKIGNIEIPGKVALAPMAGVTDIAFRHICRRAGSALTCTEMVSAKALVYQDGKTRSLLAMMPDEHPACAQIFGSDAVVMGEAAQLAREISGADFIDINMGCPAPKVAGNGGGSALMKDPVLAAKIVRQVVDAVPVPVTFKIRAGWDDEHLNAVELALRCEEAGAVLCTVHGRTREQRYAPPVNLDIIRDVKRALSIPVVGNGDITSPAAAVAMMEHTGCDMVMVGRAAAGAPWLFHQINEYFRTGCIPDEPTLSERMAVLRRQVGLMTEYKGEYIAMLQARKQASFYMRGIRGAAKLRTLCGSMRTLSDLDTLIARVLETDDKEQ